MPIETTLDYATFIDNAMRGAVKDILRQTERTGLPGKHHFFISYRTDYPGVEMSQALRAKYPKEITIVMQHQFWDLRISEESFTVSLSFSNVPEKLVIPFAALTGFADPSTKFGLKFNSIAADNLPLETEEDSLPENAPSSEPKERAEIITLDAFRKK